MWCMKNRSLKYSSHSYLWGRNLPEYFFHQIAHTDSVSAEYGGIHIPIFQVLKHQTPLFSCCYAITAAMLSLQAFEEKVGIWPKSVCTTTETVFNSSSDSSAQLWVHFHPFPSDRSLDVPPACFTWLTWLCGSYLSSWKEGKEKYHIRYLMDAERSTLGETLHIVKEAL